MRYRNLKTGAIINSPCSVSGGDWVAEETTIAIEVDVEEIPEVLENKELKEPEEPEVDLDEDIDGITIKQIKQELDAFGIEYNPRAKKQELYDLMMQGR
jgi:hypothetical protein